MIDREVIAAFVRYLRQQGHPGLKVDRLPDEVNRKTGDIDAIAGPFAIEHTSINTVPHQRRDSARSSVWLEAFGESWQVKFTSA